MQKGINNGILKTIATIAMLIDHIGFVIVENYMNCVTDAKIYQFLIYIDLVLRLIGRIAFPIFCFLLIEGFIHTHNVKKYIKRLALFALISEIPFNIAHGTIIDIRHQNVFFTLLFGVIMMSLLQKKKKSDNLFIKFGLSSILIILTATIAEFLHTDYGAIGILCIAVMYLLHTHKIVSYILGIILLLFLNPLEISAFLSVLLIYEYNGRKGTYPKWLFYVFYPAHLLILGLISFFLINF